MTQGEIMQYKDSINKMVYLYGYTSTSLDRDTALKFAWENSASGHQKVLFHIIWNEEYYHYYMNAGAYDHEKEILI